MRTASSSSCALTEEVCELGIGPIGVAECTHAQLAAVEQDTAPRPRSPPRRSRPRAPRRARRRRRDAGAPPREMPASTVSSEASAEQRFARPVLSMTWRSSWRNTRWLRSRSSSRQRLGARAVDVRPVPASVVAQQLDRARPARACGPRDRSRRRGARARGRSARRSSTSRARAAASRARDPGAAPSRARSRRARASSRRRRSRRAAAGGSRRAPRAPSARGLDLEAEPAEPERRELELQRIVVGDHEAPARAEPLGSRRRHRQVRLDRAARAATARSAWG